VDGELRPLNGTFPAEFQFEAMEVELAFALVNPKEGEQIKVEVVIDGKTKSHSESPIGVHQLFASFGYAEWVGGTSIAEHLLSQDDASLLITRNAMPTEGMGWSIISRRRR